MKITITFNLKKTVPVGGASQDLPEDAFEEFDAPETVDALACVLRAKGHHVSLMEADLDFLEKIKKEKPDFVFNIAEGYEGRNRESYVPNILEFLGIPHTGSDGFTLALSLDKELTKMVARRHSVRTPDSWVIEPQCHPGLSAIGRTRRGGRGNDNFFLKPLREGSSKGIRISSLVHNKKEFQDECNRIWKDYGNITLLAEEYVRGREITVGVLGTENPRVLGMMEIGWKEAERRRGDFVYSFEVKRNWRDWVEYEAPAPLMPAQHKEMELMAVTIHRALECRDISRVDFRLDEKGIPYFLEINPLPGLSPDYSDLVLMIRQLGMTYEELILSIFEEALRRYKRNHRGDVLHLS